MTKTAVATPDPDESRPGATVTPITNNNASYTFTYPTAVQPSETTHEVTEREYDDQGRVTKETTTRTTTRTERSQPYIYPNTPTYPIYPPGTVWSNTGNGETITFGGQGGCGAVFGSGGAGAAG